MPGSEVVGAAYRLHAAMCTEIAERTSDLKNRLVLLKMAPAWLRLAEQAEKNSQIHKTPKLLQQQQQPGADVSKTQDQKQMSALPNGVSKCFSGNQSGIFGRRAYSGTRLPPTPIPAYVSPHRQDLKQRLLALRNHRRGDDDRAPR